MALCSAAVHLQSEAADLLTYLLGRLGYGKNYNHVNSGQY